MDTVEYQSRSMMRCGNSHPPKKAALIGYIMPWQAVMLKNGEGKVKFFR
jgi:hypothetical protein